MKSHSLDKNKPRQHVAPVSPPPCEAISSTSICMHQAPTMTHEREQDATKSTLVSLTREREMPVYVFLRNPNHPQDSSSSRCFRQKASTMTTISLNKADNARWFLTCRGYCASHQQLLRRYMYVNSLCSFTEHCSNVQLIISIFEWTHTEWRRLYVIWTNNNMKKNFVCGSSARRTYNKMCSVSRRPKFDLPLWGHDIKIVPLNSMVRDIKTVLSVFLLNYVIERKYSMR